MGTIKITGVGDIEPSHELSQIAQRGLKEKMKMLCEVPDYVKLAPYFTDFLYSDPFFNNLLNIIVVFCQAH